MSSPLATRQDAPARDPGLLCGLSRARHDKPRAYRRRILEVNRCGMTMHLRRHRCASWTSRASDLRRRACAQATPRRTCTLRRARRSRAARVRVSSASRRQLDGEVTQDHASSGIPRDRYLRMNPADVLPQLAQLVRDGRRHRDRSLKRCLRPAPRCRATDGSTRDSPAIQDDGVACAMYVAKQSRSRLDVIFLSRHVVGALTRLDVQA